MLCIAVTDGQKLCDCEILTLVKCSGDGGTGCRVAADGQYCRDYACSCDDGTGESGTWCEYLLFLVIIIVGVVLSSSIFIEFCISLNLLNHFLGRVA